MFKHWVKWNIFPHKMLKNWEIARGFQDPAKVLDSYYALPVIVRRKHARNKV